MQSICSTCKKILGEKCGICGNVVFYGDTAALTVKLFWCGCGHTWKPGEEPVSHGYCPQCLRQAVDMMLRSEGHLPIVTGQLPQSEG